MGFKKLKFSFEYDNKQIFFLFVFNFEPPISCCNYHSSVQETARVNETHDSPAVIYNCENFYGHYDNRRNINLIEPKPCARKSEREYQITMKRFMIGRQ